VLEDPREHYLAAGEGEGGGVWRMKRSSRAISEEGGGARLDELTDQRGFWENFSKMQEVAATATEHMRDL